jgi:hypothetical protein
MVRLGFDVFCIHVRDREISNVDGNLLKNEHLGLFNYLLTKIADCVSLLFIMMCRFRNKDNTRR